MGKAAVVIGVCVLLGAAWLTAIRPAYAFAYALCILFTLTWAWPRAAASGLRLERRLDPGTPVVGEAFEESFEISRSSWVPAPWVEVVDLGSVPGYQPGRVVSLGAGSVRWRTRGVYSSRGWMDFGPTALLVHEPFGLFASEVKFPQRTPVLVYPRIRPMPDTLASGSYQPGVSQTLGAWADWPPEAGGVRDYQSGDSYSRIHWPLSMHHQTLVSKAFEQPLADDLWLVLDLDREVHFGVGESSTLECAVSLAASLAAQVTSRTRQLGLLANDSRGTLLEPHRAPRPDRLILDYLAVCQADGRAPLVQALAWERFRNLPRRGLVVITPSPDSSWARLLQLSRGWRTAVSIFYIDATSFGAPTPAQAPDLGQWADLYIVRNGDDFARLARWRPAPPAA